MIAYTFLAIVILSIGLGEIKSRVDKLTVHYGENVNHGRGWRIVAGLVVFASFYWSHGDTVGERAWSIAQMLGAAYGSFTPYFRLRFNHLHKQAWWYMGPEKRGKKDSKYDTVFWWLCAKSKGITVFTHETWKTIYAVGKPWYPGVLAFTVELTVLALCTAGYFLLTNT